MAIEPSSPSRAFEDAVEHRALGIELHVVLAPVGGLARLGVVAAQLQRVALSHQYFRSSGSHWVIVTSE